MTSARLVAGVAGAWQVWHDLLRPLPERQSGGGREEWDRSEIGVRAAGGARRQLEKRGERVNRWTPGSPRPDAIGPGDRRGNRPKKTATGHERQHQRSDEHSGQIEHDGSRTQRIRRGLGGHRARPEAPLPSRRHAQPRGRAWRSGRGLRRAHTPPRRLLREAPRPAPWPSRWQRGEGRLTPSPGHGRPPRWAAPRSPGARRAAVHGEETVGPPPHLQPIPPHRWNPLQVRSARGTSRRARSSELGARSSELGARSLAQVGATVPTGYPC